MKYRIELAATAKADIRGQAQWLRENVSPAAATKWLDGLYKAIDTLQTRPLRCQTRPLRCPVAAESDSSLRKSTSCSTASVASGSTSIG
jgi:plasmid stabilization system protein ParE